MNNDDEVPEEIIQRIERLNNELIQEKSELTREIQRKDKLLSEYKQLNDVHTALEEKFNQLLSEKAGLENQLDSIRVQMQTTESKLSKNKQDFKVKFFLFESLNYLSISFSRVNAIQFRQK